jgi:hypothetical protein
MKNDDYDTLVHGLFFSMWMLGAVLMLAALLM